MHNNLYYPAAQFHRKCFESQLSELQSIIRGLGANNYTIEITSYAAVKNSAGFKATAAISKLLGANAKVEGSKSSDEHFSSRWEGAGHNNPAVPKEVFWLQSEPVWNDLVSSRMNGQTTSWNTDWEYTDTFGINAMASAVLKGIRSDAYYKFEHFENKRRKIRCEFPAVRGGA